jgi:hypothetical protein
VGRSAGEQPILLREFDPASAGLGDLDVPDPYYGGPKGFEDVLDLVQAACVGLFEEARGLIGRSPEHPDDGLSGRLANRSRGVLDVAAGPGDAHPSAAGS